MYPPTWSRASVISPSGGWVAACSHRDDCDAIAGLFGGSLYPTHRDKIAITLHWAVNATPASPVRGHHTPAQYELINGGGRARRSNQGVSPATVRVVAPATGRDEIGAGSSSGSRSVSARSVPPGRDAQLHRGLRARFGATPSERPRRGPSAGTSDRGR
jgi:hypothetical protein